MPSCSSDRSHSSADACCSSHKIKEADFGLSFPAPSASRPSARRVSSASSRPSTSSRQPISPSPGQLVLRPLKTGELVPEEPKQNRRSGSATAETFAEASLATYEARDPVECKVALSSPYLFVMPLRIWQLTRPRSLRVRIQSNAYATGSISVKHSTPRRCPRRCRSFYRDPSAWPQAETRRIAFPRRSGLTEYTAPGCQRGCRGPARRPGLIESAHW